ncbi:cathepsin W-like [Rhynchocyon petersi]
MAPATLLSCLQALLLAGLLHCPGGFLKAQVPEHQLLELKEAFVLFQTQYNRSYSDPAEYARRLDIFTHNMVQAQKLQEEDLGTAEFGVTPFSDLTEEEFDQVYGHQKAPGGVPNISRTAGPEGWQEPAPPACDWRKAANIIKPIRDQKSCQCCWAIAAAGNIEALWGIKYQQSVEVSVQELIDCARCGNVWDAYIAVLNNSGLASETEYPFQGDFRAQRCQAQKHKKVAWIQDFIMLQEDEQKIAWYLATEGPITVTINKKKLQHYQKGVIKATPATCDPNHVDHSVQLVGFGKTKPALRRQAEVPQAGPQARPPRALSYWILKNSWGPSWGEKGYFLLHRGSNTCGITKYPLTARVSKPSRKKSISCPH